VACGARPTFLRVRQSAQPSPLGAAGFVEAEYGILLNHKSRSVTGKYVNRDKLNERKMVMMTEINRVIVEAAGL
jgi:hypothetical protein